MPGPHRSALEWRGAKHTRGARRNAPGHLARLARWQLCSSMESTARSRRDAPAPRHGWSRPACRAWRDATARVELEPSLTPGPAQIARGKARSKLSYGTMQRLSGTDPRLARVHMGTPFKGRTPRAPSRASSARKRMAKGSGVTSHARRGSRHPETPLRTRPGMVRCSTTPMEHRILEQTAAREGR